MPLADATVQQDANETASQDPQEQAKGVNAVASVRAPTSQSPIPVIIFAFDRPKYLRLTIDSVIAADHLSALHHPIFVSQSGDDSAVAEVIASYGTRLRHLQYISQDKERHPEYPERKRYQIIARHYEFALSQVMDVVEGHDLWNRVIMLEDDMDVSPDFFTYFRRLSPLLDTDPSLYCISAWNANGQSWLVASPTALYRTDCFPGLGWMWSRERWSELREWTWGYWDDWLIEAAQRKGRSCIYPEINRVYTFGHRGSSSGQFWTRYLKRIRLNSDDTEWDDVDISYLDGPRYDVWMDGRLRAAVLMNNVEEATIAIDEGLYDAVSGTNMSVSSAEMYTQMYRDAAETLPERRVTYRDMDGLAVLMEDVGLMPDHKAGLPRASYKGVLHYRHRGVRIWITPENFSLPLG